MTPGQDPSPPSPRAVEWTAWPSRDPPPAMGDIEEAPVRFFAILFLLLLLGCSSRSPSQGPPGGDRELEEAKARVEKAAETLKDLEAQNREMDEKIRETEERLRKAREAAGLVPGAGDACSLHGEPLVRTLVPVSRLEFPAEETYLAYLAERERSFPNCDDAVPAGESDKGGTHVERPVCPECNRARDAYVEQRGK